MRVQLFWVAIGLLLTSYRTGSTAPVSWIGGDGNWQSATNWSTGALPGQADDVTISVPAGDITVTYNGTSTVRSLTASESLHLVGGSLELTAASLLTGPLQVNNASLNARNGEVNVTGSTTSINASLAARAGGTLQLPGLSSYSADNNQPNIDWRAEGAGSVLNLSQLDTITLDGNQPFGRFNVQAIAGGHVDLPELDSLQTVNGIRPARFISQSTGSVVDISQLVDLSDVWELRAEGGEIRWSNPASITNVGLTVSSTGQLNASNVTTGRNNWLTAFGGGTLSLPALASFTADDNQANVDWRAEGAGSVLNLSQLDTITVDGNQPFGRFHVVASAGGRINLQDLDAVQAVNGSRPTRFYSQGTGSVVDISQLANLSDVTELRAEGGEIRWSNPASITEISLAVSSTGQLNASNVTTGRNNWLTAFGGGTLSLPALASFTADDNQANVDWRAEGAGSVLNLSQLDTITLDGNQPFGRFHVVASAGGRINLQDLDAVQAVNGIRPTRFYSQGAGSVVDISQLTDLSSVWELRAEGGEIRWSNPTSITEIGLAVSSTGQLNASNVTTGRNNWLTAFGGGTLSLPALASFTADDNQANVDWRAEGAGSVLNLSQLDTITLDGNQPFGRFHVVASAGGRINLQDLDSVQAVNGSRPTRFYSQGTGSVVDISQLTDLSNVWELRAEGGEIRWSNPASVANVGLFVSTTGQINASNVTTGRNNWLTAFGGGTLSLPALANFTADDDQFNVDWRAEGAGSVLNLPQLDTITLDGNQPFGRFHVVASAGGRVNLQDLDLLQSVNGSRPTRFYSQGAGSLIDLSGLPRLSGASLNLQGGDFRVSSQLELTDGATVSGTGNVLGGLHVMDGTIVPRDFAGEIGKLSIQGNVVLTGPSTLIADVTGTAENRFDEVTVAGQADLAGRLELRSPNAVVKLADQIRLLHANAINGAFDEVAGIPIPGAKLGFAVRYTSQDVFARVTLIGDVNFDNEFNSGDMVEIFQAGEYEDTLTDNSTWVTGDWTGDGEFDTSDLVAAFTTGAYETGPVTAMPVPEPVHGGLMLMMLAGLMHKRARRR